MQLLKCIDAGPPGTLAGLQRDVTIDVFDLQAADGRRKRLNLRRIIDIELADPLIEHKRAGAVVSNIDIEPRSSGGGWRNDCAGRGSPRPVAPRATVVGQHVVAKAGLLRRNVHRYVLADIGDSGGLRSGDESWRPDRDFVDRTIGSI